MRFVCFSFAYVIRLGNPDETDIGQSLFPLISCQIYTLFFFFFFLISVLQLTAFQWDEKVETRDHYLTSMGKLLLDPYIIIVAG